MLHFIQNTRLWSKGIQFVIYKKQRGLDSFTAAYHEAGSGVGEYELLSLKCGEFHAHFDLQFSSDSISQVGYFVGLFDWLF